MRSCCDQNRAKTPRGGKIAGGTEPATYTRMDAQTKIYLSREDATDVIRLHLRFIENRRNHACAAAHAAIRMIWMCADVVEIETIQRRCLAIFARCEPMYVGVLDEWIDDFAKK